MAAATSQRRHVAIAILLVGVALLSGCQQAQSAVEGGMAALVAIFTFIALVEAVLVGLAALSVVGSSAALVLVAARSPRGPPWWGAALAGALLAVCWLWLVVDFGFGRRPYTVLHAVALFASVAPALALLTSALARVSRRPWPAVLLGGVGLLAVGLAVDHHARTLGPAAGALVKLDAALTHACALERGGRVWCWGADHDGELDDGDLEVHPHITRARGLEGAVDIAVGPRRSCALLPNDDVACWGRGERERERWPAPRTVEGLSGRRLVVTEHAVFTLSREGALRAWATTDLRPLEGVRAIAGSDRVGGAGLCAATAEEVVCWPSAFGGLAEPVPVSAATGVEALAVGTTGVCALSERERVRCWRFPWRSSTLTPAATLALPPVRSLAAAGQLGCALTAEDALWCWGAQAPPGVGYDWLAGPPREVAADVETLWGMSRGLCARLKDGRIFCTPGVGKRAPPGLGLLTHAFDRALPEP